MMTATTKTLAISFEPVQKLVVANRIAYDSPSIGRVPHPTRIARKAAATGRSMSRNATGPMRSSHDRVKNSFMSSCPFT
jgi:hypothetical protein